MARESTLWTWLAKARLQADDSTLHMERVENMLAAGFPDVEGFLSFPGYFGGFLLELKSSERPARIQTPIRFKLRDREKQIEFMHRRWCMGANAFFLLQVGSGHERQLYLAPGSLGWKLKDGMHEAELAIECAATGMIRRQSSQIDLLKRVVSCRRFPAVLARYPLPNF